MSTNISWHPVETRL